MNHWSAHLQVSKFHMSYHLPILPPSNTKQLYKHVHYLSTVLFTSSILYLYLFSFNPIPTIILIQYLSITHSLFIRHLFFLILYKSTLSTSNEIFIPIPHSFPWWITYKRTKKMRIAETFSQAVLVDYLFVGKADTNRLNWWVCSQSWEVSIASGDASLAEAPDGCRTLANCM